MPRKNASGHVEKEINPIKSDGNGIVTLVVYVLQILAFALGLTAIIGLILNYIKLPDVQGTWLASHFRWQIRTFWFGLIWSAVSLLLCIILIGYFLFFLVYIWWLYRVIKGLLYYADGKEMY